MDNTTLPAAALPMQDTCAVLVLFCSLAWLIVVYTSTRAFQDIASHDDEAACFPDDNLMGGLFGLLSSLNFTLVATNVSEALSSTWSQHCWTLLRQMLWVHLSEHVVVSTLAFLAGFLLLLARSICKEYQGWDNWWQRRNAYKQARDIEEQLECLKDGVEGK
ncbi:hypothetical protein LTR95_017682 [Oleoguttula sp. CCFEE 5521]